MTLMAEYRNKHDGLNLITAGGKKQHFSCHVIGQNCIFQMLDFMIVKTVLTTKTRLKTDTTKDRIAYLLECRQA